MALSKPVRSVAIIGKDAALWLTALALRRALSGLDVELKVVELPSSLSPVEVYPILPSAQALHSPLNITEAAILTAVSAVPMVGQRYSGWSADLPPFFTSFESSEAARREPDLHQLWVKARLEGLAVPFQEFSVGVAAAKRGRVPSEADTEQGIGATYGYHVDATGYTALLKALAVRRNVSFWRAVVADVRIEEERIEAVVLADGTSIVADLFIDVSGTDAILVSQLNGSNVTDWAKYLPCNRLLATSISPLQAQPAFSQITAFESGWVALYPLQNRIAVLAAFDSAILTDSDALRCLAPFLPSRLTGEPVASSLHFAAREEAWTGNCVGVGDAAASLDYLDASRLHFVQACVSTLVNLFPTDRANFPEADVYNETMIRYATNIRDYQAAHYKLNGRMGDEFWDRARSASVPPTLAHKLKMFKARGQVPLYDNETFETDAWAAMFIGHGLVPRTYDPRADSISDRDHIALMHGRLQAIGASVPHFPTISEFIAARSIPTPRQGCPS